MKKASLYLMIFAWSVLTPLTSCIDSVPEYLVSVDYSEDEVPMAGGLVTINVSSNTQWNITRSAGWITSISPENGSGDMEVTVTVAPNSAGPRADTLIVSAGQTQREVIIKQEGLTGPFLIISQNFLIFDADEYQTKDIFVNTNVEGWTVEASEDWITVTPAADRISVQVDNMTAGDERTGSIILAGEGIANIEIYIFQSRFEEYAALNKACFLGGEPGDDKAGFSLELESYLNLDAFTIDKLRLEGYTGYTQAGDDVENSPQFDNFVFAPNVYNVTSSGQAFTLTPGEIDGDANISGSYLVTEGDDAEVKGTVLISQGFVNVELSGSSYSIYAIISGTDTATGDTKNIRVKWTGGITFTDCSTREQTIENFTDVFAEYYGNLFSADSKEWMLCICYGTVMRASDTDRTLTRSGYVLYIDLYAEQSTDAGYIPDGTYTFSDTYGVPQTYFKGWSSLNTILNGNTTYYSFLYDGQAVTISRTNNTYTINLDVMTEDNLRLKGTYEGGIALFDLSDPASYTGRRMPARPR